MKVELSDTEVFTVVNGLEAAADALDEDANKIQGLSVVSASLKWSAQHYRKQAENIQQQWEADE